MENQTISLLEESLDQYHQNTAFFDWACIQDSLGHKLHLLGQTSALKDQLQALVESLTDTAEDISQDDSPEEWAIAQFKLAEALHALGVYGERDMGALQRSSDVYKRVLTIWRRTKVPFEWAAALNNLGMVLQKQGEKIEGTHSLDMSVATFNNALTVRASEDTATEWAITHNCFGFSFHLLGVYKQDPKILIESCNAYKNALMQISQESNPLAWVVITSNLANVKQTLAEQNADDGAANEVVDLYYSIVEFLSDTNKEQYLDLAKQFHSEALELVKKINS